MPLLVECVQLRAAEQHEHHEICAEDQCCDQRERRWVVDRPVRLRESGVRPDDDLEVPGERDRQGGEHELEAAAIVVHDRQQRHSGKNHRQDHAADEHQVEQHGVNFPI